MSFWSRKKPKVKKEGTLKELERHTKLIEPYINVPLVFRNFPVIFLTPIIKEGKVYYRYKTNECLPGHCKLLPVPNFTWKFGQTSEWNTAKYNYLRLVDTIKKYKKEGYEV